MKKILKIVSITILVIAFLSLYGYSVRRITEEEKELGIFTKPVDYISHFPRLAVDVLKSNELRGIPPTFKKKDADFENVNHLDYDLYALNSFFNPDEDRWEIKLFNLRNDSVKHVWYLNRGDFYKSGERIFANARPKNCVMLPDKSVIFHCVETNNMFRLDSSSNILWHNTQKNFHHSINIANDGNIWIPTSNERKFKLRFKPVPGVFREDFITKIDAETGKILYDEGVVDILLENGYKNYVYGFSNTGEPQEKMDPLHLNDIQPAYSGSEYWEKGDLFLSLRHKSLVFQYRPGTGQIIRIIQGPLLFQHDVDIISDHEIAIFNNNTTNIGDFEQLASESVSFGEVEDSLLYSQIIIYDFRDSSFRNYLEDQFKKENIYTINEGSYEFLSTGDVWVESQNDSKLFILNDDKVIYKRQFETPMENFVYMPNWIRIYEELNF